MLFYSLFFGLCFTCTSHVTLQQKCFIGFIKLFLLEKIVQFFSKPTPFGKTVWFTTSFPFWDISIYLLYLIPFYKACFTTTMFQLLHCIFRHCFPKENHWCLVWWTNKGLDFLSSRNSKIPNMSNKHKNKPTFFNLKRAD